MNLNPSVLPTAARAAISKVILRGMLLLQDMRCKGKGKGKGRRLMVDG